jgi:GxxExxY protein
VIRLEQRLDDALEALIHMTIGCCIDVHRALGPGLLENIYRKAICLELNASGIRSSAWHRFTTRRSGATCGPPVYE